MLSASTDNGGNASSPRRSRAPIACQRCKRRKTKVNPKSLMEDILHCIWPGSIRQTAGSSHEQARLLQYAKDLEKKVAELEARVRGSPVNQMSSRESNESPQGNEIATEPYSLTTELSTDVALLSMNATAEPFYIGATSGFSLSKMVEGILSQGSLTSSAIERGAPLLIQGNRGDPQSCEADSLEEDPQLELKLAEIFFSRIHPRYPFLDKASFYSFLEWYQSPPSRVDTRSEYDNLRLFQLHMVFAISARLLQLHPEMDRKVSPDIHYSNATRFLDGALRISGYQRVQCLLLLVLYVLRTPGSISNLGSWHIVGIAMRYAVESGMHRNIRSHNSQIRNPYMVELKRRVFWSTYILDRAVSLTLGRPFALSESDIDVPLPVDIDDDITDADIILQLQQAHQIPSSTGYDVSETSNLSSFVHLCRLRRLESRIKQKIYSTDIPLSTSDNSYDETLDSLRNELTEWLDRVRRQPEPESEPKRDYCVYDTQEFYRIQYSKSLRMLLQHRISPTAAAAHEAEQSKTAEYLTLSSRAAGDICQYYKTLHQRRPLGWNLLALHSIFTAGLTLLYCIWADKCSADMGRFEDVRACSNVLFAIAERWPTAKRFRDIFEVLAQRMADLVAAQVQNHEELDDQPYGPEYECGLGALAETMGFAASHNGDFWAMLDELVDDEYIRHQFRLDGLESQWEDF
ncbi:hypothetical protein EYZ11_003610 [Aspergillus tanneri]|uniref:Xylanolytic transcriptional activator regulatory domain-containing protein n=1 Tax=Aspergillus tanneri TaxID=1220188 RepID=A0A4S3JMW3_9EURO|nr:hypothetical protein EYZ11_003610 [Aspergillus tanneri]